MYLGCRVKIPRDGGNITVKTISGTPYVYIERGRAYSKEKKYSIPKRTCIGKRDPEQPDFMFPNEKFLKFFPRELLPEYSGVWVPAIRDRIPANRAMIPMRFQ